MKTKQYFLFIILFGLISFNLAAQQTNGLSVNCPVNERFPVYVDADNDGYGSVYAGAFCNLAPGFADNNLDCDDQDSEANIAKNWYKDRDEDGLGSKSEPAIFTCIRPVTDDDGFTFIDYVANDDDCDDFIHGQSLVTYYLDSDGDGYGSKHPNDMLISCTEPTGYVTNNYDADDTNALVIDIPFQQTCPPHQVTTVYLDRDRDGVGRAFPTFSGGCSALPEGYSFSVGDCDDEDPTVQGGYLYEDVDGDGFGDPATQLSCSTPFIPPGYDVSNGDDCDDTDPNITIGNELYLDEDGDGYGSKLVRRNGCQEFGDYVFTSGDCDDSDPAVNPTNIWYADSDSDGFGDPAATMLSCDQPYGYVANNLDQCPSVGGKNSGCPVAGSTALSDDKNYIRQITPIIPLLVIDGTTSSNDYREQITYYDDRGRAEQTIAVTAGGNSEDIITHFDYDPVGKQIKEFLPYAPNATGGDKSFRYDGHNSTSNFYNTAKYENTLNPYSEKHFEDSPLNRVLEQGAPGADWIVSATTDTDHTIKFGYGANTDADFVRQFNVSFLAGNPESPQLQDEGLYSAGTLYKIITKDENWQPGQNYPTNHTTEEYKDKQGRVILKRTFESGGWHDTYYVYDDYGNLTYVLPPEVRTYQSISQIWDGQSFSIDDVYVYEGTGYQNTFTRVEIFTVHDKLYCRVWGFVDTAGLVLKNGLIQELDFSPALPDMPLGDIMITNTSGQTVVGASARIENGDLYFTSTGEQQQGTSFFYNENFDLEPYQSAVVPPGLEPTDLDRYGYQYKYDGRNRLVEKKIPGKGWEYIVYDNLNRPVMTQDANQKTKSPKEWTFTKYDVLGRVIYTGLYHSDTPVTNIRDIFKNKTAAQNYETKVTSGSGYNGTHYTNDDFPYSGIEVLTANYYDNYAFDTAGLNLPVSYENQDILNHDNTQPLKTQGLATGTKIAVLDNPVMITTITGYDTKGRPIYVASDNPYLGTTDIVRNKLDFVGNVEKTETAHTKSGTTINTEDVFAYDHANRLTTHKQDVNSQGQELIVKNVYDELGQLVKKEVGNTEVQPLQKVDYTYNIRGWLKRINDPTNLAQDNDLFGFGISYNNNDLGGLSSLPFFGTSLYNGNIFHTYWKTNNVSSDLREYTYRYDALNRFKTSFGFKNNAHDYTYREGISSYDKNGNILKLFRSGFDSSNSNGYSNIDDLTYGYEGNKLLSVTDSYGVTGVGADGFKDGNTTGDDYRYDANGNMVMDLNKGIGSTTADGIVYNHLNLPTYIEINDGGNNVGNITYIYDAMGNKQTKRVTRTGANYSWTNTYYAGNYVYENYFSSCSGCPSSPPTPVWLKFINQPEGYIEPKNELDLSQGFDYVYQYRDHLGDIRLSYKDSNEDGSITGGSTQIFFDDFETASGWDGTGASWGHPISSFDSNFKLQGNYAGRIDRTGSSSVAVHSLTWVPINNSSDTEYIYSGWAYSNGPTIRLGLAMKEAGETGYLTLFDDIYVGTKNTWVYVEKRVIVPANMVLINLRIEANSSNVNGTVWWDNVSIRKINDLLAVEILEENNYYPFGLKHKGYNNTVTSTNIALKRKFGGKEYQDELGLDWYDITARNYDPALGRWMNLDPLAELMRRHSPYNYAFDNPIFFIDPDGMAPVASQEEDDKVIVKNDCGGTCDENSEPTNEIQDFLDILNKTLEGFHTVDVTDEGELFISRTDKEGESSKEASNLAGILTNLIDMKETVEVRITDNSDEVLGGSYALGAIDMADVKKFGDGPLQSGAGVLTHELVEQYEKQVNGLSYRGGAHDKGIEAENLVNGSTRVESKMHVSRSSKEIRVTIPFIKNGNTKYLRVMINPSNQGQILEVKQ